MDQTFVLLVVSMLANGSANLTAQPGFENKAKCDQAGTQISNRPTQTGGNQQQQHPIAFCIQGSNLSGGSTISGQGPQGGPQPASGNR